MTSNLSVNTDAPCAWLRPRTGSPVTTTRQSFLYFLRLSAALTVGAMTESSDLSECPMARTPNPTAAQLDLREERSARKGRKGEDGRRHH